MTPPLLAGRAHDPPGALSRSAVPILVIDDSAAKRLGVQAVLAPLGYCVVEADSGVAGLRCLMEQDFAVILLDVKMPVMDGFQTAALIRMRRESEMTPIIFITAHSADEIKTDRYAQGAVDFISTPVNPDELRAKISVFANLFLRAEALAAQARQVQSSADELSLLTETAPIGIFRTDAEHRYIYTNPRWDEITGVPSTAAIGRPWDFIIHQDESDELALAPAAIPAGPVDAAELSFRFDIQEPGSAIRIALMTSKPILDPDGGITGWVGTLADITAEAGAEAAMSAARDEATEASRLKSDFLANMSHEIRTPMNGVLGMTDLLLETELDAVQRDYAQTVRNSGEALLIVINDILDFSKIESGALDIEDVRFSVQTVVDDVVALLGGSARAKGLTLRAVLEDGVPAVVSGDPGRLRQVLTNLIGNAVKFTEVGEVLVRVSAATVGGPEAILLFEVSDSGVGIAPEKLELIFEPFVQADTSTSRKYGGTGLGLAISSQLVALMGGDVGVSSRLGVGSTFRFTICVHSGADMSPYRPATQDHEQVTPAVTRVGSQVSSRVRGGARLLLAEDNLINQKVALAMLSGAGYRVDTALTGVQAVEAAALRRYDVILMDCQMPEMNGYEATAAIRADEGSGRRTPIIALTAGARREDRERCLAADMDSYLAKPVSKDALLTMVRQSVVVGVAQG